MWQDADMPAECLECAVLAKGGASSTPASWTKVGPCSYVAAASACCCRAHIEPFYATGAAAAAPQLPGVCRDNHASCPHWASIGECDKNPVYMRGDQNVRGNCRLSCKVGRWGWAGGASLRAARASQAVADTVQHLKISGFHPPPFAGVPTLPTGGRAVRARECAKPAARRAGRGGRRRCSASVTILICSLTLFIYLVLCLFSQNLLPTGLLGLVARLIAAARQLPGRPRRRRGRTNFSTTPPRSQARQLYQCACEFGGTHIVPVPALGQSALLARDERGPRSRLEPWRHCRRRSARVVQAT